MLGIIKAVAFFFTGNVAMFDEMMHSFGAIGETDEEMLIHIGNIVT